MAVAQRIVACMLVYNSAKILGRALSSLRHFADAFVFVDGFVPETVQFRRCWYDWTADGRLQPASIDGTEQICREWGTFVPAPRTPWTTAIGKRNRYIAELHDGDWMLVMDPDEVFNPEIPKFLLRRQVFANEKGAIDVRIRTLQDEAPLEQEGWGTRLIRWRPGLHYCRNHATIWGPDDTDITSGVDKLRGSIINDHRGLPRPYGSP